MTEPNEPKIIHFPPRVKSADQDTAGNWEPDEQLFGLEELQKLSYGNSLLRGENLTGILHLPDCCGQ